MLHNSASTIVNLPTAEVVDRLRHVEGWRAFLDGVLDITRVTRDRYTFTVQTARGARQRDVRVHVAQHGRRLSWRALSGPRYQGVVHLTPVDGRRTLVKLSVIDMPYGIVASFTEMVMHREEAVVDLQRLEQYLRAEHIRLLEESAAVTVAGPIVGPIDGPIDGAVVVPDAAEAASSG